MFDTDERPRWVKAHQSYFGSRFTEGIYRTWTDILVREMGADGDMLLDAVNQMIRHGQKGFVEDHLRALQAHVAKSAKGCTTCNGRGLVEVPNLGPRRESIPRISFVCRCPRGVQVQSSKYPDSGTLAAYEDKHGTSWRDEPSRTVLPIEVGEVTAGNMGSVFRQVVERLSRESGVVR